MRPRHRSPKALPIIPKGILRDPAYLIHLRGEPCLFTGLRAHDGESVVAMHIGTAGRGIKSPDDEALPIVHGLHMEMHNRGEITVIREKARDWLIREAFRSYAREMYASYRARRVEQVG